MPKRQEHPITQEAPADRAKRKAGEAHEADRLAYLAGLDPRQQADLSFQTPEVTKK